MTRLLTAAFCLLLLTGCAASVSSAPPARQDAADIPDMPEDFAVWLADWVDPLQKNVLDTY